MAWILVISAILIFLLLRFLWKHAIAPFFDGIAAAEDRMMEAERERRRAEGLEDPPEYYADGTINLHIYDAVEGLDEHDKEMLNRKAVETLFEDKKR